MSQRRAEHVTEEELIIKQGGGRGYLTVLISHPIEVADPDDASPPWLLTCSVPKSQIELTSWLYGESDFPLLNQTIVRSEITIDEIEVVGRC